ncbi:hypothetical protein KR054_002945, partial [Drosophila jambulina]
IYKLKKPPVEIEPDPETEPAEDHISSESDEVAEEQTAVDHDFTDDSDRPSDADTLSLPKLEADSDEEINMRLSLLRNIRYIPDWDELSATTTIGHSLDKKDSDWGEFRYPLDGSTSMFPLEETELLSDVDYDAFSLEEYKKSSTKDSEAPIKLSAKDSEATILHISPDSDSELESSEEADNWKQVKQSQVEVDHIKEITQVHITDSSYRDLQEESLISEELERYVYELVDKALDRMLTAEHRLKKTLDKQKLFNQLQALVQEDYTEREKNDFLMGRLTTHHMRRSKFTLITPETTSTALKRNKQRCQNAFNELDCLLQKEQETEKIYHTERERLQMELEEQQLQDEQNINRLEDCIKDNLLPYTRMPERLEHVIENALKQMRKKRNEISETRMALINMQHINSYVMQKLEKTETISEGLKLHTYEATLAEVDKLDNILISMLESSFIFYLKYSKYLIPDKTADLHRLYEVFCSKLHIVSHLRCRRKLLSRTFQLAEDKLFSLRMKHATLRAKVYKIHVRKNQVLAQIQEARYKGGLLNYPLLRLDFDNTVKLVSVRRERVGILRTHHDSLLKKIEDVELAIQTRLSETPQDD